MNKVSCRVFVCGKFLAGIAALFAVGTAVAADYHWTGAAGDHRWSTAGNWADSDGNPKAAPQDGVAYSYNFTNFADGEVVTQDVNVVVTTAVAVKNETGDGKERTLTWVSAAGKTFQMKGSTHIYTVPNTRFVLACDMSSDESSENITKHDGGILVFRLKKANAQTRTLVCDCGTEQDYSRVEFDEGGVAPLVRVQVAGGPSVFRNGMADAKLSGLYVDKIDNGLSSLGRVETPGRTLVVGSSNIDTTSTNKLPIPVFARAAVAGEESFFPFVISYDARDNAANVSRFLSAPAGRDGFVRVEGDAFVNDAGPVRFHATNLTGPANFPAHADADALAARLARLGVNCVRLHFMDTWYVNFMPKPMQGILADDSVTQRKLDPAQLDKMDYLIAALKRRGVYVDLNLHVGRTLDKRDGLPDGGPWANKCVGQFMPRMIELQKEYARDLLTHVNAYTGNAYVDEPAVAMIEISNEDSLLRPWLDGSFFGYPDPFCLELARQWNAWLRRTYGSKEAVAAAWTGPVEPLGEDLVRPGWRTEKGPADVSFALTGGVCRATVTKRGDEYHPKAFRTFPLRKGRPYTLEFKIRRLRGKGPVSFAVASTANGWTCLGLQELVNPVRDWLIVNRSFVATADCGDAFVQFTRLPAGVTDIRDVTLRPGALPPDVDPAEGFASGEVPLATRFDSAAVRRDFLRFLRDTELAYWTGLRSYVKDGLKAHAPVSGTQLDYSPQVVQGRLDYIDQHSYWRHPSGGWISLQAKEPWTIGADSMVNSLANMLYLSGCRVVGKPYTISEYNHPYPNPFGAEGQPMLAAFAAFQGWSGVFQYGYNHYVDRWAPDANPWCFFDSIARTDVLAHFPACSAMVLRGDVARARGLRAPSVTSEDTLLVQLGGSVATDYARAGGGSAADAVLHAVGVSLGAPVDRRVTPAATGGKTLVSDTGELVWNREKLGKAYFAVKAPQVKLFTGFPEGRTVDLGGVRLSVGRTSLDWATVSLVSRDATGFGEKGAASILLAATAGCGNAGRVVKRLPGGMWTLPDRGHGPVMAEGVPLTLTLPAKADMVACWALDGRGERKAEVPVKADADGRATVAVGPEFRTVWYELAVR